MKFRAFLIKQYLLLFIYSQLIATVVSYPILVYWGLPISLMTFLGNLLFSPVLSLFLVLSSLAFVSELLDIPNYWLLRLLELNTTLLEYLLGFGRKSWLLYFPKPHFLMLIIFISLPILFYKKISKSPLKTRIFILSSFITFFVGSSLAFVRYLSDEAENLQISKLVVLKNSNGCLDIFDNGEFSRKSSPSNYVEYELRPTLAKKFGSVLIDNLHLGKASARSFEVAEFICSFCHVKNIKFSFNAFGYKEKEAYRSLKKVAREQKVKILVERELIS